MDASQLFDRTVRAARLDPRLYEEVEGDGTALPQALLLVVLSSIAAGVGVIGYGGPGFVLTNVLVSLILWYLWAFLIYWIGARVFPEPGTSADHGELLRVLGFAAAPGLLRVLGVVPGIGGLLLGVVSLWMLAATVVAVRQALDYHSTLRAVGVCLVGWIIMTALIALIHA